MTNATHYAMRQFLATAMLLLLCVRSAVPQQPAPPPDLPPPPPPDNPVQNRRPGRATFSMTMSQVVVNVSVTDRNGKPVENLTTEDFEILEDGKPQVIKSCEFQRLGTEPLTPMNPAVQFAQRPSEQAPRKAPAQQSNNAEQLSKYQDRRLIVMLFDFSSMDVAEQIRARDAALKFLATQMTASDMVSIMVFGSALKTVQDFTSDRDLLTDVIHRFHVGEAADLSALADTGADAQDQSGMFTADDTEFNIFNTDRKLAALQEAAQKLSQYPEKKALVYISSGVPKTGVDNQSQLEATVNAAVRANVSFFPIDARGLVAQVPGGDATQAGAAGSGLFSGAGQRQLRDSFQDTQETLYTLAADTGGKALLDTNDLVEGFRQVQEQINSYYMLAYSSTNQAEDGRYRRIQVRLAPRLANLRAKLDYRKGYFAPTTFARMREGDKETQLQQALDSESAITDIPLALEVDYFRIAKDKYFVPITVRIPGSALAFQTKGSKRATALDFIAQVRDAKGRAADNVRDMIPLKVDEQTAGEVSRKQIVYDTGLTLPPGKYTLRFIARENGEGKIGTFQRSFTIPELANEKTLRVSSLVLSNQLQSVKDQLAGAKNDKKLVSQNPLVEANGQKLLPNVTRVFRPGQTLYAFMEVYDPATPENMTGNFKIASVASTLALYTGETKVFETEPLQLRRFNSQREGTIDIRFQTSLKNLKPGRYSCQVNVIDELGRKFAFQRVPVVIASERRETAQL
jgi:VWFA-related protein